MKMKDFGYGLSASPPHEPLPQAGQSGAGARSRRGRRSPVRFNGAGRDHVDQVVDEPRRIPDGHPERRPTTVTFPEAEHDEAILDVMRYLHSPRRSASVREPVANPRLGPDLRHVLSEHRPTGGVHREIGNYARLANTRTVTSATAISRSSFPRSSIRTSATASL